MSLEETLTRLAVIEKRYRSGERGIDLYLEAKNIIAKAPIEVLIDPRKYKKERDEQKNVTRDDRGDKKAR